MSAAHSMTELIERKKAGDALTGDELRWICTGFVSGEIPDYQVAAWLMAVRWRGMSDAETLELTRAMVESGEQLSWPADRPVVDKHSTGGVGDKTSIVLVPLLASAGVTFVKMSGRGLGHTGGTIDKLESIPGFRVELDTSALRAQVERIGCALVGQSRALVPADGALYALRDVTATVDSVPLIASSVMSKKLAAGARGIVLDVKYGSGAFMATREDAATLAEAMVRIGTGAGRRVRAVLGPMEEPLGSAVGNALEVAESIEVLHGGGPEDLRSLVLLLGAQLMVVGGVTADVADAVGALERLLGSGVAARHFERLIEAQRGDPRVVESPERLGRARVCLRVPTPRAGWVRRVNARGVADVALALGAGRRRKGDPVDPLAGVRVLTRSGDRLEAGDVVAEIHAATDADAARASELLLRAISLSDEPTTPLPAAHEVIGG